MNIGQPVKEIEVVPLKLPKPIQPAPVEEPQPEPVVVPTKPKVPATVR